MISLRVLLLTACCGPLLSSAEDQSNNKTPFIRVTTIPSPPFVMRKNQDYEGYLIDLLKKLSEEVGFDYKVSEVKDGSYGVMKTDQDWNGMVGEVLREEADLAVADLTITTSREDVVDFTYPFLTSGIGVLAKRPPYYLQQSGDDASGRLQQENHKPPVVIYPVSSVDDLPHQDTVNYGAVRSGSTFAFFKDSQVPLYKAIYYGMRNTSANSYSEGITRVKQSNGKYMFFMETVHIEYATSQDCDLIQLGKKLNTNAYGLALRKNSPMRSTLSGGIVKLEESGFLAELKKKWFPEARGCERHLEKPYAVNALNLVLDSLA